MDLRTQGPMEGWTDTALLSCGSKLKILKLEPNTAKTVSTTAKFSANYMW